MQKIILLSLALSALSGCAAIDRITTRATPAPAAAAPAVTAPPPVLGAGATAATLDTTTEEEKQAALAAPAASGERALGTVSVSLGGPAEPGIWLRSALVTAAGKGRVVTASGQSVAVDLLPGQGAAQLSLAAYVALGLPLTALPEVTVFAN
ncbi:hypothetical protein [Pseudotabrizicola formosa]|uniref:hypothetical protein n=1 Tax=Pseudotabrizicola formosa TaxID=2030009 RepID=UPI000CD3260C|nr:hypothetical protein [Pseudotabrizicola formosa]